MSETLLRRVGKQEPTGMDAWEPMPVNSAAARSDDPAEQSFSKAAQGHGTGPQTWHEKVKAEQRQTTATAPVAEEGQSGPVSEV